LLSEDEILKLVSLGGQWVCIRWTDPFEGIDKDDHKFRDAVEKYLNGDNDEEAIRTCQFWITGAWFLNNRRHVDRLFSTADAIQLAALPAMTLKKICYGGVLNDVDKEDIINATINF
jgi:hypothetical protein